MANEFNLQNFLGEYKNYTNQKYNANERAKANMEENDENRAKEAIQSQNLLQLTVGQKLTEIGIGKRVVQQVVDTASGIVKGVLSPFEQWLEENEHIFDENVYNAMIQSDAKQTFFAMQAMSTEATYSNKINGLTSKNGIVETGTKFMLDM